MRKIALAAVVLLLLVVPTVSAQTATAPVAATDGPGATSHFDLARKDCFGTARNTTSRVWYTLANGVLSDIYYPTLDNTNAETMQYIATDGSTFTDLQARDMTYSVSLTDPQSMSCQITTEAKSGKYRVVSQYLTEPANQTLLIRVRFVPLVGDLEDYRLYVRLDPTINGRQRYRPPLATPVQRAWRIRPGKRQSPDSLPVAPIDARLELGSRLDSRAGLGAGGPGAGALRRRSDRRIHRLPQRPSGRVGRATNVGLG